MSGPIVIAAGGTGGHLFPGQALGQELQRRGREIAVMTDTRVTDVQKRFPDVPVYPIPSATPYGGGALSQVRAILPILRGTLAAYAFSRFKVPLKDDLMFFILSTRMMPPIAVAIPIFLMFRQLGLSDTHLGMILLYTAVNLSLSVWLLKGFIDEVIMPQSTRKRVSRAFASLRNKQLSNPWKKHDNIPL